VLGEATPWSTEQESAASDEERHAKAEL